LSVVQSKFCLFEQLTRFKRFCASVSMFIKSARAFDSFCRVVLEKGLIKFHTQEKKRT